ncbi:MAG: DUF1906 domain-containing protein [Gemmatimonadaceae bacterium]|nr:DUF1906 domain-containing protein [Gemmatimonadaceae bacterium]NUQ93087.1 DUF1906 domain-containing protein [Gemmatimonadaceae bacterium]NUR18479.1 DUF1906 domain-containing protein [Gemmatimonadaceae bacterium]NUS95930.1 DUF1906 domain-containing protein [Gemmatimonadaceae bacterium]
MHRHRRLALAALTAALAACTDAGGILGPAPVRYTHPGFDTAIYPGDAAMVAWRAGSPYEWVGYYLAAPCHRDPSWTGKRALLTTMGWGTAVLYVGQQTWEGVAAGPSPAPAMQRATQSVTCSRTLLGGAQGTIEGIDAAAKTANEGFPAGTTIYLDVEYMTTIPQSMRDYYRSWVAGVLADGRYVPGVYVHRSNAAAVHDDVLAELAAQHSTHRPRFWIAGGSGFTLDRAPTDVGHAFANMWQGKLDSSEAWNGVTLLVDESVSDGTP